MKRKDFMQIIKLRSIWKVDRRKGNYTLPSGEKLSWYIGNLVESQLAVDKLGIGSDGNLYPAYGGAWNDETKNFDDYTLTISFKGDEICPFDLMERRIKALISEIVGC